jgi:transposase InsO family protein
VNVTAHPTAERVWRQLIEATPWGEQPKHLIRDRDCCCGGSLNAKAASLGIEAILTPVQAPKANAVAERVVGTLRRECLDHIIVINERQLLRVMREYMVHYNPGRPHRSLNLETLTGPPALRRQAGSSLGRFSVVFTTSTSVWPLEVRRYG